MVSESGNNFFEAAAIGSVMNNRMKHKGTSLSQANWLSKISGKSINSTYNGYESSIYFDILDMTDDQFNVAAASVKGYGPRIRGALLALPGLFDYSSGSYFWNATSQQYDENIGPNWRGINNGTYMINTQIGGSTFFKYTNPLKTWP